MESRILSESVLEYFASSSRLVPVMSLTTVVSDNTALLEHLPKHNW